MRKKLKDFSLQTKLVGALIIALTLTMMVYGLMETKAIKAQVEDELSEKGEALVTAGSEGIESIVDNTLKTGVILPDGTKWDRKQIIDALFDENYTLIPESKTAADKRFVEGETQKRFDGITIPMAQYEYKYSSKMDPYTDTYFQKFIDGFLSDKDIVFAIPTKNSSDPSSVGYIPTHNSVYSPMGAGSVDNWGDAGLLSQKYRSNRIFNDEAGQAAASNTETAKPKKVVYNRVIEGKTVEMWDFSYPIHIDGRHWGGFRVAVSKQNADAIIAGRIKSFIAKLFIIDLLMAALLLGVIKYIFGKPVKKLLYATQRLADGEGDLTYRIPVNSHDELGKLADNFNSFIISLQKIFGNIKNSAESVASASEELSAAAEEMTSNAEASKESSGEVADSIAESNKSFASIAEKSTGMYNNVSLVAVSLDEMTKAVNDIVRSVQNALELINMTVNSANQIGQSIKNSAQESENASLEAKNMVVMAEDGRKGVEKTISEMEKISLTVEKLSEAVKKLGGSAGQISEITDVIEDISEQTNLLALNAAIEAARAGDQGKGFAVVATAIRQLSEKSHESTSDIIKLVDNIKKEVDAAITTTNEGAGVINYGVDLVKNIGTAFEGIFDAIIKTNEVIKGISQNAQAQTVKSTEVIESIKKVEDLMQNISSVTEQQAASINEILTTSKKMANITSEVTAEIQQQSQKSSELLEGVKTSDTSVGEIASVCEEVANGSTSLAQLADELLKSIEGYKIN